MNKQKIKLACIIYVIVEYKQNKNNRFLIQFNSLIYQNVTCHSFKSQKSYTIFQKMFHNNFPFNVKKNHILL